MRRKGGIAAILRTGQFPGTIVRGTTKGNHGNIHVDKEHAAPNLSKHSMTPHQREMEDKRQFQAKKRAARATQMARRGTRRADDEVRLAGHIPFGVYTAMRKKHGNDYWDKNPKEKLRRHGLNFDG